MKLFELIFHFYFVNQILKQYTIADIKCRSKLSSMIIVRIDDDRCIGRHFIFSKCYVHLTWYIIYLLDHFEKLSCQVSFILKKHTALDIQPVAVQNDTRASLFGVVIPVYVLVVCVCIWMRVFKCHIPHKNCVKHFEPIVNCGDVWSGDNNVSHSYSDNVM